MAVYFDVHTHSLGSQPMAIYNVMLANPPQSMIPKGYFSAGIHPWDIPLFQSKWLNELEALCKHPDLLAIGEAGLDRLRGGPIEAQYEVFEAQVRMSIKHKLPLVLHCVKAHDEVLKILFRQEVQQPIIFHGFQSGWKQAVKLLDHGMSLSFGKALLNPLHPAAEVFKKSPSERVFLETDTYLGGIASIYEAAAKLWQLPVEAVAERIYINVNHTFKLDDRNLE
jgi:TatD DNase family protein